MIIFSEGNHFSRKIQFFISKFSVATNKLGPSKYTHLSFNTAIHVFTKLCQITVSFTLLYNVTKKRVWGGEEGRIPKYSQMCVTFFQKHQGKTSSNTKFQHFKIIFLNELQPLLPFFLSIFRLNSQVELTKGVKKAQFFTYLTIKTQLLFKNSVSPRKKSVHYGIQGYPWSSFFWDNDATQIVGVHNS